MDLILNRNDKGANGVFGTLSYLQDGNEVEIAATLEHAYDSGLGNGSFISKIPDGEFSCVRGQHRLATMTHDFTTFEITGVTGHSNILFHPGNTEKDSEGCVLLGSARVGDAVINSRVTFEKFMTLQNNINEFKLKVTSKEKA
jgi:hypothetical protein